MRRSLSLVTVAALVALAGCGGLLVTDEPDGPTATPTGTAVETATETPAATAPTTATEAETATPSVATETPTATPAETTTATGTRTPDDTLSADNPWGQEVVPVRVNDTVGDRNTTALTLRTIDYWNANIERYTDFEYRFALAEDPSEARVEVQYKGSVGDCDGQETDVAGCAAYLTEGTTAHDLEVVEVESGRSNTAVLVTARHEFGHLVGLGHSDKPLDLMAQGYEGDITNATDRPFPWYGDTIHVAVEPDAIEGDPAVIREQVGHAVTFYDDGANGSVPTAPNVVMTDDPATAEVIVTNESSRGCTGFEGSQGSRAVQNLDTDPAPERYSRLIVCMGPVGEDAVGWHTGYWLGTAFGLEDGERAPAFRNATYSERRSEWWE